MPISSPTSNHSSTALVLQAGVKLITMLSAMTRALGAQTCSAVAPCVDAIGLAGAPRRRALSPAVPGGNPAFLGDGLVLAVLLFANACLLKQLVLGGLRDAPTLAGRLALGGGLLG